MRMHRAIKTDLYPTIGNSDLVAAIPEDGSPPALDPRADYLSHMGLDRTYYSFNAAGYHLLSWTPSGSPAASCTIRG